MKEISTRRDHNPSRSAYALRCARLLLKPARPGTGVKAGSKPRIILEAAGIKDVVAKSLGSANPINLVLATVKALSQLKAREDIALMRGVS